MRRSRVIMTAMVGALLFGCATTGDIGVSIDSDDPIYISPANADGVQDAVTFDLAVVPLGETRLVGYRVAIENAAGAIVFSKSDETEEIGFFASLFGGETREVVPPELVLWDGRDHDGDLVPDGSYRLLVTVEDANGNTGTAEPREVVVDNTPPSVDVSAPYTLFTPNGDDRLDVASIYQRNSSHEELWTGRMISENGETVRTFTWIGGARDFLWDGTTDAGTFAEDGTYTYRVSATDLAGNTGSGEAPAIVLERAPRVGTVTPDRPAFSPNGDGRADTIFIRSRVDITENLDSWTMEITDARGTAVRTYEGTGVPGAFSFDGLDDSGTLLPDGPYRAVLSLEYAGGQRPRVTSPIFALDTAAPQATVRVSSAVFSPRGGRDNDAVRIIQSSSDEREWVGTVTGPSGEVVLRRTWSGRVDTFEWDGTDATGSVVADGLYTYTLSSVDEAENESRPLSSRIRLDTTPPSLSADLAPPLFSPDDDGVSDTLTISIAAEDPSGVARWHAELFDPAGNHFREWSGTGVPRDFIRWDGTSESGELVQSAEDYALVVTATDRAGNTAELSTTVPIDILVVREGDRLRIRIASIYFEPYTANYLNVEPDVAARNQATLDRLAEVLEKYPHHTIQVEGHAVQIYWYNGKRARTEHEEVLVPLSTARADAIVQALVERGVEAERMTVVGQGGALPVVPHNDLENRWKNRRVEFILERR
ncbi:MAG: FlgD immunoglobulin-like domain containing protein [bacterium]